MPENRDRGQGSTRQGQKIPKMQLAIQGERLRIFIDARPQVVEGILVVEGVGGSDREARGDRMLEAQVEQADYSEIEGRLRIGGAGHEVHTVQHVVETDGAEPRLGEAKLDLGPLAEAPVVVPSLGIPLLRPVEFPEIGVLGRAEHHGVEVEFPPETEPVFEPPVADEAQAQRVGLELDEGAVDEVVVKTGREGEFSQLSIGEGETAEDPVRKEGDAPEGGRKLHVEPLLEVVEGSGVFAERIAVHDGFTEFPVEAGETRLELAGGG